jgi:putative membrane protein
LVDCIIDSTISGALNKFFFILTLKQSMELIKLVLIGLVALAHLYFLYLEMFAWETSGRKAFKGALRDDLFGPTKVLAANQGLYNGFLAAGLIWAMLIDDPQWAARIATFFLGCVVVAGVYGALTASRKIFFVQALPALLALGAVWLSR